MTKKIIFILGLFTFANAKAQTQVPNNNVQSKLNAIVADPSFANAGISCYVYNTQSKAVVAKHNENLALTPASVAKLVSTSTAMSKLGTGYRFKTELYIQGIIDSLGTLHGNIFIKGGGDPTLGSKYYNIKGKEKDFLQKWSDTISNYGIKRITGSIIGDGSIFGNQGAPGGWSWSDLGNYYGAAPSGLSIYDNQLQIIFKTGATHGDSTKIICTKPYVEGLEIKNYVTSSRIKKDNSYAFTAPYSNDYFTQGTLPLQKDSFVVKGSIANPVLLCALELENALEKNGITVGTHAMTLRDLASPPDSLYKTKEYKKIYTNKSPSLLSIAKLTNQRSVNLFAESLLSIVGAKRYGNGSTYNGSMAAIGYWSSKIKTKGMTITDGSGLSRSNGISSRNLTDLLTSMAKSKYASSFKSTLAVAGKSGTLSSMCRRQAASGRVKGKSGSMTRVKAYSGYVDSKTGKKLTFTIIVNNFHGKSYQVKKKLEGLFNAMAVY